MVSYLNRLGRRMSDRNFPADDPMRVMVVAALKAMYELHAEVTCRSMEGKGLDMRTAQNQTPTRFYKRRGQRHKARPKMGSIRLYKNRLHRPHAEWRDLFLEVR
jgi:hypothetical protein